MDSVKSSKIEFKLPDSLTDLDNIKSILDKVTERLFSPRDLKISSRVFQHWKDFGLMPYQIESEKWVRLNFIEYIWASIICDLRKMGYSLTNIKELQNSLFEDKLDELVEKEIEKHPEQINRTLDKLGLDNKEKENYTAEKIVSSLRKGRDFRSLFEMMLISSLILRSNNKIYITTDGIFHLYFEDSLEQSVQLDFFRQVLNTPHRCIPLSHYIFNFIDDKTKESFLTPLAALNDEELNVLKAIRNMEFKEIIVKPIKGKEKVNGIKYDIITVKDGELSEEQQKQITEILSLKNYQSITLKKKNNSSIYFERESRRKA